MVAKIRDLGNPRDMARFAFGMAKHIIEEGHDLIPAFHVYRGKDEKYDVVGAPWSNQVEKLIALGYMRTMLQMDAGIASYALAVEGYRSVVKNVKPGDEIKRPSQDPKREDVITVLSHSRDGRNMMITAKVTLLESGRRIVGEPEEDTCMEGLLGDSLFKPMRTGS